MFARRILREQWIRAKYEREEFIHVEKQRYSRGTMEGFLFKRSKVDDSCKQRRFVLSERDNTLKYYVSNVRRCFHFFSRFFNGSESSFFIAVRDCFCCFFLVEKGSQGGNSYSRHERSICPWEIETSNFPSDNLHQSGTVQMNYFLKISLIIICICRAQLDTFTCIMMTQKWLSNGIWLFDQRNSIYSKSRILHWPKRRWVVVDPRNELFYDTVLFDSFTVGTMFDSGFSEGRIFM